jgi:hypothetical protein
MVFQIVEYVPGVLLSFDLLDLLTQRSTVSVRIYNQKPIVCGS